MMLNPSSEERIKCGSEKALEAKSEYVKPVLLKHQNLVDITCFEYNGSHAGTEDIND